MATGIYERKKKDPSIRFFRNIKINSINDCWEWTGYRERRGYGKFGFDGGTLAHRFSYLYHKGEITEGMQVCHSCDNTSCVNPDHLWLGTNRDNQVDCIKKGRAFRNSPKGSRNGLSKLTETKVKEIRKLKKEKVTEREIAKRFGISKSNVFYITSRRTWKHVS